MGRVLLGSLVTAPRRSFSKTSAAKVRTTPSSPPSQRLPQNLHSENYTAKDFRTWSGTVQTVVALKALGPSETITEGKKKIRVAIEVAAKMLGNTPTICRKCYVHPAVLEAYASGVLYEFAGGEVNGEMQRLNEEEAVTLELLQ